MDDDYLEPYQENEKGDQHPDSMPNDPYSDFKNAEEAFDDSWPIFPVTPDNDQKSDGDGLPIGTTDTSDDDFESMEYSPNDGGYGM